MDRDKLIEAAALLRNSKNELVLAVMALESAGLPITANSMKGVIEGLSLSINKVEKHID